MVLAALVISVAILHGVSRVGAAAVSRQRAQSVADLAALAGAAAGRGAAAEVAGRNSGALVHWGEDAGVVSVKIRLGGVIARAAAS